VASVIRSVAANASGDAHFEARFTNALDKLGDALTVIRMVGCNFLADLDPRSYVITLVELSMLATGGETQDKFEIIDTI
jgi:hypothetical protein